jgi:hypothetical protein
MNSQAFGQDNLFETETFLSVGHLPDRQKNPLSVTSMSVVNANNLVLYLISLGIRTSILLLSPQSS